MASAAASAPASAPTTPTASAPAPASSLASSAPAAAPASAAKAAASSGEGGEEILLVLHAVEDGVNCFVQAKRSQPMRHLLKQAAEAVKLPQSFLRFVVGGKVVKDDSVTPASLGLCHGSTVVVFEDHSKRPVLAKRKPVRDCHFTFRKYFEQFYDNSDAVARTAVTHALSEVKRMKSMRALAAAGSGFYHMVWVAHRFSGDETTLLAALRLICDAALHSDDVAQKAVDYGVIELCFDIGTQSRAAVEVRAQAARLIFNCTHRESTRLHIVDKGGINHFVHLTTCLPQSDTATGAGLRMMLSTAKMGVMFCLVQSVRKSFVKHAGTQDALLVLATHSNADVQLRAAKMIRSLTADSEVLLAFREWHRLIEILEHRMPANTYTKAALGFLAKAARRYPDQIHRLPYAGNLRL